jgi:hypothetical protein
LIQVNLAERTAREVFLETHPPLSRQRTFEVVGHQLDELFTRQVAICGIRHGLGTLEVALERAAHAVQEHALICLGNLQDVTHLLGRPPLHIPQGDDFALGWRQRCDRPMNELERFSG